MNNVRWASLTTIAVAALAVLASFLVPLPQDSTAADFYTNLALTVATVIFYIGASIVISMGFGAFTSKLRRAYIVIFVGLSLWGLAYLQLPLLVIIGELNNDSAYVALSAIPFILSAVLTFTGTRMLAKLFAIKNIAMSWWFALGSIAALCVIVAFLPHAPSTDAEIDYDMANSLIIFASTMLGFAAYHVLLIKRQASVAFANALAWLCLSMFLPFALAGGGSTVAAMILTGPSANQITILIALIPGLIAAGMFLRSAYSFNKIVESTDTQGMSVARNFFGKPLQPRRQTTMDSIDIVVYAAGLASNPKDVDAILDDMRVVTSRLQEGEHPSAQDEQTLMNTYLQLEKYLLQGEPIRKFTGDSIRRDIAQKLRLTEETSRQTFWSKLPPLQQATGV